MRKLNREELEDITDGAVFLASGGGGPINLKRAMVDLLVKEGPVEMAGLDEVADDAQVAVVAGAGSPETLQKAEGIESLTKAAYRALTSLEESTGKTVDYIVAIETGSGNTLLPMGAAVRRKIPILDGAGAPRSVPSIPMCTFGEEPISPIQLVDEKLNVIGLHTKTADQAEDPVMTLVSLPQFGSLAGLAMWPMSGKTVKACACRGTVSKSLELGRVLRTARDNKSDPVKAAIKQVNGYKLFEGTLEKIESHKVNSLDVLVVVLKNKSGQLRLYGQNETLIAWISTSPYPLAMAPDLICYLTGDGEPFSNADIRGLKPGTEIAVIGVPAPGDLRTDRLESLFLTALRNMGYGGPYVAIEQLSKLKPVVHGAAQPTAYRTGNVVLGW